MTDRTHPDSGRATGQAHIIRYALELGLLWIDGDGRDKVREALDALDTLEAQLEAIGAGGVSGPLMARASLSANAGEPTCDMRAVVAVAVTMLYDTHPEDVCRVFDLNDLKTIVSITEPLRPRQVEDIYRDAWDRLAAPPTAQAEGWRLVPVEPTEEMLAAAHEADREYTLRNFGDVMTVMQGPYDHWAAMIAAAPTPPTSAEGVGHG